MEQDKLPTPDLMRMASAGQYLQASCHAIAYNSGWWTDLMTGDDVRTWDEQKLDLWVASKLMLVVTEVAEAMEGLRKHLADDKLPHKSMLEVELADAVIRICDLAGGLGLNLGETIMQKSEFNMNREDHKPENRILVDGKSI